MAPALSVKDEVRIKAPASLVWSLLTDTSTYPSWNKFVTSADVLDAKADDVDPQYLKLGSRRRFHAKIYGFTAPSLQRVTIYEVPGDMQTGPRIYKIGWVAEGYPSFLFNSLRSNEVEEVEGEDGPECIYRTGEDQFGPLAHVIKTTMGGAIEQGIKLWAINLKEAAEAKAAELKQAN